MAAPVARESNLPLQNSDRHLILIQHRTPPHPADDDFTISQLIRSKNSPPPPPPPSSPLTSSLGKRKKSKPVRYGVYIDVADKTHTPSPVAQDSSNKSSSSQKGSSATKHVKSKLKSPPAMIKAGEVQSSLGTKYPSCIKMVKAHADTVYWMGFPLWFGKLFLPKTDSEMVIEDENAEIHHVKYNAEKSGLSAGWKKFAAGHNLLEGDVLVFHLVEPYKFKVYIVRANDLKKADDVISLLNMEARTEQMTPEAGTPSSTPKKTKRAKPLSSTMVRKKHKLSSPSQIISHSIEQSGNNSEEIGSEVLEGSRPSKPDLPFQELEAFKDFHIMVKGVCIDSELPDDVRMNYFKLCTYRKEFLHDCLPENFYYKLVAGMIGETVNIANEIKNCKLTTTKEEFDAWDNSLKSFSQLGMKVGFLRDMIAMLARLVFESEGRVDTEKYMEAKKEHKRIEDEIKRFTEELKKLKESSRKIQGIVDGLEQKVGEHEVKFQEEVNAPW